MKNRLEVKQSAEIDGALELYIYGEIEADSPWSESETSSNYVRRMLDANRGAKEITVYINSVGGYVAEGVAIGNLLKRNPAKVTAVIDGFACSAASLIACSADRVVMPRNSILMIHNAWTYAVGNADQLRKVADDLDAIMVANRTTYLDKAGGKLSEQKLIELLDAETYLTAEQALEYGLCDEVVEAREIDAEPIEQLTNKVVQTAEAIKRLRELSAAINGDTAEEIEPAEEQVEETTEDLESVEEFTEEPEPIEEQPKQFITKFFK